MLTQITLKRMLSYNPNKGVFVWISKPNRSIVIGRIAGTNAGNGYKSISIFGIAYYSHRLACLYMTGSFPKYRKEIDHINGKRDDNRWRNLRIVNHRVNTQNQRRAKSNSKTGILGIRKAGVRFEARIVVSGKQRHIGVYDTPEQAFSSYLIAKRKFHSGCTI